MLQASMKVWATTLRQESTMFAFPRSNTKLGFLIRLTQNLYNTWSGKSTDESQMFCRLHIKVCLCFIFES